MSSTTSGARARALTSTRVLISGAGPAGIACALVLLDRGFTHVTILESSSTPTSSNPARSYSFCIYERGQRFLRRIAGLHELVSSQAAFCEGQWINFYPADADPREIRLPLPNGNALWMSRAVIVGALEQMLEKKILDKKLSSVRVICSAKVTDMEVYPNGGGARVFADTNDGRQCVYDAELVIACDGIHSAVRQALRKKEVSSLVASTRGFEIRKKSSPSVGMAYKSLMTTPYPLVSRPGAKEEVRAGVDALYALKGCTKGRSRKSVFSMGVFPLGNVKETSRVGVVVLKGQHDLWKVTDVEEGFRMFEQNFPHLRIRDIIPVSQMEHFVKSKHSHYPHIQRAESLVGHFKPDVARNSGVGGGVLLLGDAAHAFPPDLGQGINSAFEDVQVLQDVLREASDACTVNFVLDEYEKRRDKDVSALMMIMRHGFPYQYNQSKIGLMFFMLNAMMRKKLAKLAPNFLYPSIDRMVLDDYAYNEVWQNAQMTTRRIWAAVTLFVIVPSVALVIMNM